MYWHCLFRWLQRHPSRMLQRNHNHKGYVQGPPREIQSQPYLHHHWRKPHLLPRRCWHQDASPRNSQDDDQQRPISPRRQILHLWHQQLLLVHAPQSSQTHPHPPRWHTLIIYFWVQSHPLRLRQLVILRNLQGRLRPTSVHDPC